VSAAPARRPAVVRGRYRFPWREGNRFELLNDGLRFYPRMLEEIGRARHYVLLEIYLFESGAVADRFIDAFVAAAGRGVAVRLLLDDFGARGLKHADRERLESGGVEVLFYNRLRYDFWTKSRAAVQGGTVGGFAKLFANFARDHRKLLLVDGEVAFVGGAGITDAFDPPAHPQRRWREIMLEIHGPVVGDWQRLFAEVWNRHSASLLVLSLPLNPPATDGMAGRVTLTRAPRELEIPRALIKRVRAAERRVWIMTAYFVPSWRLRRALRRAARRGVDVRLLLPGPITDHPGVRHAGRRFYARLLAHGVRIYEYQPRFLHAKCALVDDWVSSGSSNLDRWNLRWNLEANQEIDDTRFASGVAAMFEGDFGDALECRYEVWRRRPWTARARERFWGKVDLFLHRLGRGRQDEP
jgi:phosphatidylserine/phosphatidylglycerophosphate/cardiolipin synthase-like enzyme